MWKGLALVLAFAYAVPFATVATQAHFQEIQRHELAVKAAQARQQDQQVTAERYLALSVSVEAAQLDQAYQKAAGLQQRADAADAKAADLQAQVDKLTDQLAAVQAGVGSGPARVSTAAPAGGSTIGNHFPFGWCTYYVATRRNVPWMGNAITWLWGARGFGFPTGSTPRVGAIMVSAESVWGHVAYVESVSSNGSFVVSEMNWSAWGVVDFRTVLPGKVPVLGFIY